MENFKFIYSNILDPQFNIASEEYLLKQKGGYYVYVWRNFPAVIIGSSQNTLLEVNVKKAEELGVKIVRRLTGGGAVYHDLNNVCFTVIAPFNDTQNNYIYFTEPVIKYLNSLGVKASFSGRNDICIGNKKISGNAQVIYKDRIMHHGTLLFNSDLSILSSVLTPNKLKTESKGIKSNRARVDNIKNHLPKDFTIDKFVKGLCEYLKNDLEEYTFSDSDVRAINSLVKDKYGTYEWNIGYSPKGSNRLDARFNFGTLTLTFDLVNGTIENAEIFGDYFPIGSPSEFIKHLNGKRFNKDDFLLALSGIENHIQNATAKEIVNEIF